MPHSFHQTFSRAFTPPLGPGVLKHVAEDFIVIEELAFPLSGEGEHCYLKIRKKNQNTQWVCRCLARYFPVKERDIGYAGLKDRHAVTTQWFSLPMKTISEEKRAGFNAEGIEILEQHRHLGKLRKGTIKYNYFEIILREVDVDIKNLDQRIKLIRHHGVPNYFDEQRFGRQRQNLQAASQMFKGRLKPRQDKQRIYISAARSWLFNQIVAQRVERGNWFSGLAGDVFLLDGSKTFFSAGEIDERLQQRLIDRDIHPTAALWGEGELTTSLEALQLEQDVFSNWSGWCKKLVRARLQQQRRAVRVVPVDLVFDYQQPTRILKLQFKLPSGAYASNLVREIIELK